MADRCIVNIEHKNGFSVIPLHRAKFWTCLLSFSQRSWSEVEPLIKNWWTAYKDWERTDTFNRAFRDNRMSPGERQRLRLTGFQAAEESKPAQGELEEALAKAFRATNPAAALLITAPTASSGFYLLQADQPIGREIEALGNDQQLPGRA